MPYLTPQEKSVVLGLCLIVFAGTLVNIGLQKNIRVFNWLHIYQENIPINRIDINKASVEDLLRVPGIGPKTAEFIASYRLKQGAFKDFEPLHQARGMSPERYERIIKYFKI